MRSKLMIQRNSIELHSVSVAWFTGEATEASADTRQKILSDSTWQMRGSAHGTGRACGEEILISPHLGTDKASFVHHGVCTESCLFCESRLEMTSGRYHVTGWKKMQ